MTTSRATRILASVGFVAGVFLIPGAVGPAFGGGVPTFLASFVAMALLFIAFRSTNWFRNATRMGVTASYAVAILVFAAILTPGAAAAQPVERPDLEVQQSSLSFTPEVLAGWCNPLDAKCRDAAWQKTKDVATSETTWRVVGSVATVAGGCALGVVTFGATCVAAAGTVIAANVAWDVGAACVTGDCKQSEVGKAVTSFSNGDVKQGFNHVISIPAPSAGEAARKVTHGENLGAMDYIGVVADVIPGAGKAASGAVKGAGALTDVAKAGGNAADVAKGAKPLAATVNAAKASELAAKSFDAAAAAAKTADAAKAASYAADASKYARQATDAAKLAKQAKTSTVVQRGLLKMPVIRTTQASSIAKQVSAATDAAKQAQKAAKLAEQTARAQKVAAAAKMTAKESKLVAKASKAAGGAADAAKAGKTAGGAADAAKASQRAAEAAAKASQRASKLAKETKHISKLKNWGRATDVGKAVKLGKGSSRLIRTGHLARGVLATTGIAISGDLGGDQVIIPKPDESTLAKRARYCDGASLPIDDLTGWDERVCHNMVDDMIDCVVGSEEEYPINQDLECVAMRTEAMYYHFCVASDFELCGGNHFALEYWLVVPPGQDPNCVLDNSCECSLLDGSDCNPPPQPDDPVYEACQAFMGLFPFRESEFCTWVLKAGGDPAKELWDIFYDSMRPVITIQEVVKQGKTGSGVEYEVPIIIDHGAIGLSCSSGDAAVFAKWLGYCYENYVIQYVDISTTYKGEELNYLRGNREYLIAEGFLKEEEKLGLTLPVVVPYESAGDVQTTVTVYYQIIRSFNDGKPAVMIPAPENGVQKYLSQPKTHSSHVETPSEGTGGGGGGGGGGDPEPADPPQCQTVTGCVGSGDDSVGGTGIGKLFDWKVLVLLGLVGVFVATYRNGKLHTWTKGGLGKAPKNPLETHKKPSVMDKLKKHLTGADPKPELKDEFKLHGVPLVVPSNPEGTGPDTSALKGLLEGGKK